VLLLVSGLRTRSRPVTYVEIWARAFVREAISKELGCGKLGVLPNLVVVASLLSSAGVGEDGCS
jgi:hypothetical protein